MLPQIYFTSDPMIRKKHDEMQYTLKLGIKTQLGEINMKAVFLYIPIFKSGKSEAIVNLLVLLKTILNGRSLITGP